jgi:hypothetical protein
VVTITLDKIAGGGMYDQVGGGFMVLDGRAMASTLREDALRQR